jgi:hypothetical protein
LFEYLPEHANDKSVEIRTALADGDIDKTLEVTVARYPAILERNEDFNLRLRGQKLVEMIRENASLQKSSTGIGLQLSEPKNDGAEYLRQTHLTISYGMSLQNMFRNVSGEREKYLEDIISLLAYENPFDSQLGPQLFHPSRRAKLAEELYSEIKQHSERHLDDSCLSDDSDVSRMGEKRIL